MIDSNKKTEKLITELAILSQQLRKLEASEAKQKKIVYELENSELRYRRLFETAQDGILILDKATGKIIDVNPFLVNMLGYSKKDFLGKHLWEISPFKNTEANKIAFQELQEKKYIRYEHLPLETKDKRLIAVEFVSNVYSIDHMMVIQCNIRNITDRKRVEAKLILYREHLNELVEQRTTELDTVNKHLKKLLVEHKETENALARSEDKYRLLVENANEAIIVAQDGMLKFANLKTTELSGYPKEELISMPFVKLIYPDDRGKVIEFHMKRIEGGELPSRYSFRIIDKNDIIKWVEINAVLITWEGRPATLNLLTIITERKLAEEKLLQTLDKLQRTIDGAINTIALVCETRDPYTAGHQQRVAQLASVIAQEMGFSAELIRTIHVAGILHDIGKVNVPSDLLSKPGKLAEIERALIQTHSQIGYEILKGLEIPWDICPIVLQHHERMNGSGYPKGLSGEDIIIGAKILAVADVVEAMSSHRPYRPALGMDKALEEITQNKGILYDAGVVDACMRLFTEKGFKLK